MADEDEGHAQAGADGESDQDLGQIVTSRPSPLIGDENLRLQAIAMAMTARCRMPHSAGGDSL
jgi:hypothetical protein